MNLRFFTYPVERASSVEYKSRRCDARAINLARFVYCSIVSSVAPQSEFPQWLFGSSWTNWQDIQTKIHTDNMAYTFQFVDVSYSSKVMPGACFTFLKAQCLRSGKCWTIMRSAAARSEWIFRYSYCPALSRSQYISIAWQAISRAS